MQIFDRNGKLLADGDSFAGAILEQADLAGKDVSKVDFSNADLYQANFAGAILDGANFSGALLIGGDFTESHAFGTNFRRAEFCADNHGGATKLTGMLCDNNTDFTTAIYDDSTCWPQSADMAKFKLYKVMTVSMIAPEGQK